MYLHTPYVLYSAKTVSNGQPGEPKGHDGEGGRRHGTHCA